MLPEFERAIALSESIESVKDSLTQMAVSECKRREKDINESYKSALMLVQALSEPGNTEAYSVAEAYRKEYRKKFADEYEEQQKQEEEGKELLRRLKEEAYREGEANEGEQTI